MAPVATILSYRLGGGDGVAIEVRKWSAALTELGFDVRRVAGAFDDEIGGRDTLVAGLWPDAPTDVEPEAGAVRDALSGSDLVIAENIVSLPLRVGAARASAHALTHFASDGGRVLLHHHDLPWQRRALTHLEHEFPPRVPHALHVTINLRSRRELLARGYDAVTTIHNHFDFDALADGDRAATRAALGFGDDDVVLFQPARAIERKNVPGGVRFARDLAARLARVAPGKQVRYWLSGPAEDGYGPMLERVLERCPVPVTIGRAPTPADGYAASDIVLFPSTWEGFGNPAIESIAARRPCVTFPYPVLAEIRATGLDFFTTDQLDEVVRFLGRADTTMLDRNLRRARIGFSIEALPAAIEHALHAHGWMSW